MFVCLFVYVNNNEIAKYASEYAKLIAVVLYTGSIKKKKSYFFCGDKFVMKIS